MAKKRISNNWKLVIKLILFLMIIVIVVMILMIGFEMDILSDSNILNQQTLNLKERADSMDICDCYQNINGYKYTQLLLNQIHDYLRYDSIRRYNTNYIDECVMKTRIERNKHCDIRLKYYNGKLYETQYNNTGYTQLYREYFAELFSNSTLIQSQNVSNFDMIILTTDYGEYLDWKRGMFIFNNLNDFQLMSGQNNHTI